MKITMEDYAKVRGMLEKRDIKWKDYVVKGPVPLGTFLKWLGMSKTLTVTK